MIDTHRVCKLNRDVLEQSKKREMKRRLGKKSREEVEEVEDYIPGGF